MRALFICLLLLGATAAAASELNPAEADSLMELTYWEFDQTMDGGWRAIANQGRHREVAELIDGYLEHNDAKLADGMRAYLHFHGSQAWTLAGDTDRAFAHLSQATVDSFPARFPQTWNHMVRGTMAFIRGDIELLRSLKEEVIGMPSLSVRDSMFLMGLEELEAREDMSYEEVMREWEEQSHD